MAPSSSPTAKPVAYSVKQLETGEDLSRRFNQIRTARALQDIQWKLNLAYYQGRQYTYYNRTSRRIEELPTSDGEKPRYRVRIKSNEIMPGTQGLVSKMTKTKPVMNATPGSSDAQDLRAAQMAERLLEFWWIDLALTSKLNETLLWGAIASQGYMHPCWDDHAGKAMQFTIGMDGQPITDETLKAIYLEELEQVGIRKEEVQKTFYMGDVSIEVLSPWSVYLDPGVKSFDECKYFFKVSHVDPDTVKAKYDIWLEPDSVPTPDDQVNALSYGTQMDGTLKSTCRIVTGYFKPTPVQPEGRVVVWAEATKEILADDPWPYPFHELPLVKFGMLKVPGSVYDSSVVEHAIPLQQELNRTLSQIIEYKNLTIKPRVWAPVGSMRQRMTNEPGAVYEFQPIAGMRPEIEQLPSMPPYVFEHVNDITQRLRGAFYTTEIDGGTLPPNVEAFTAIDLLAEMSSDKIAPAIEMMEYSIAKVGQMLLSLAQQYYTEPRLLAIKGANGSTQVKEFTQADITGGVTVSVEAGSGLPRTRAGRMAQIKELVADGYLSPQQGLKRMDIADLKGPLAAIAADEDQALREHDKIIQQIPINSDAVRQAIQAVNTVDPEVGAPVNPNTGQPFTSVEEMQQFVHEAGLSPTDFEDFATHREQHALFMKSVEFEALPPEIQADFIIHHNQTYDRLVNLPIPNTKGPNVNLQIKSTAGPTVTAEILNRAGVYKVTPDQLMEPELPSWISEDLTPGGAPIPNDDPAAVAQANAANAQADATSTSADTAHVQSLQAMSHAEEKHQQAMQHAHEAHHHKLSQAEKAAQSKEKKPTGKA